jgi:hypothetical protein
LINLQGVLQRSSVFPANFLLQNLPVYGMATHAERTRMYLTEKQDAADNRARCANLGGPSGVDHETIAAHFRKHRRLDRTDGNVDLLHGSCRIATIGRAILSVNTDKKAMAKAPDHARAFLFLAESIRLPRRDALPALQ